MLKELIYGNTRTYLIKGKKGYLLIDTDWAGALPQFFKALKKLNITVQEISHILVTHYHPDHMGLAQDLIDLGIKLIVIDVQKDYIHQSDYIFKKEGNKAFKSIQDDMVLVLSCNTSREFLSELGIDGEIVHTPGHSEDSVSLILDSGEAVVGDLYPLEQVILYDSSTLIDTWDNLLGRQLNWIYYAHPLPDNVSAWSSIEEYKLSLS